MYSVSLDYLVKIMEPTRTIETKIDVNNGTTILSPSDIIDWNIEYSFGNDKLPGIGGAVTSMFEVTLVRENLPLTFGTAPLKPYIGLEVSPGVIEWVPLGVFYMDKGTVEKTDLTIKFKAYDVLRRLDLISDFTSLDYRNSVVTVRDVATELATVCGIQYVDITQLPTWRVMAPLTGSAREQLAELAETAGANVCVARDGKIDFRTLTPSYYGVSTQSYIEFKTLAEEEAVISTITCQKRDPEMEGGLPTNRPSSFTSGTGTGASLLYTNSMVDTQAKNDEVYAAAGYPLTYQPCYIKLQGMPMFDVGEIYTFEDKNEDIYMLPILYHKLTYKGGLISEFEATAPAVQVVVSTGSSGGTGSITQTIRQLQTDQVVADIITANKFEAVEASISTLETDKLSAEDADIAYAKIDFANVADATIGTALIQDAAITTSKIGDAQITSAKISDLSADKITSGTIDAAEITVVNLNAANITVGKINGVQIESGTITEDLLDDGIINDIQTALTSADGKNTVHYSDAAPVGTEHTVNDLWFDTDDGNKPYRWNGTTWEGQPLSDAAISNLDAGKITTGTLDAARIQAGSITASKLESNIDLVSPIVRSGKTSYSDDTNGYWLGLDSTAPKLYFGNASSFLKWTGSTLHINGGYIEAGKVVYQKTDPLSTVTGYYLGTDGFSVGTATNYLRYYNSALTLQGGTLTSSAINTPTLNVGTTGKVYGGKSAYGSGTAGFFLGYSSGYKFDIGTSTKYLRWTGTDLEIVGGAIKTGTTGERIEISNSAHDIAFYNSSNTLAGSIDVSSLDGFTAMSFGGSSGTGSFSIRGTAYEGNGKLSLTTGSSSEYGSTYIDISESNIDIFTSNGMAASDSGLFIGDGIVEVHGVLDFDYTAGAWKTWQTPTFASGWSNSGYAAGREAKYYLDPYGVVHLFGQVKHTTNGSGTRIFTLPADYRPVKDFVFPTTSANTTTRYVAAVNIVASTGVVKMENLSGSAVSWLLLDGISFPIW